MMDEQISRDHFFENKYPICTETKDNYFIKNKLNLASLSEVTNLIDRAIRNKTIGKSRPIAAIKFSNTSNLTQRIYFLRWKISDD